MSPVSESYLGITGYLIFWLLFVVAFFFFIRRLIFLFNLIRLGRPENRFDRLFFRIKSAFVIFFSQWSNLKTTSLRDPAAIGHAIMLWSLTLFAIGYLIFIGLGAGFGLNSILFNTTFEGIFFSVLDIAALLVILAMIWVIIKRYLIVPERLKREQDFTEKIIQTLLITGITLLMLFHLGIESFRYAAYGIPDSGSLLGKPLARAILATDISQVTYILIYRILWWLNYVLLLGALVYAPYSKHLHPLTSFANITFRSLTPKGSLKPVDLQKPETAGAAKIQDFTWKQLLDLYACTWCGKCHIACPAQLSGKPLSPRELILGLKEHLMETGSIISKTKKSNLTVESREKNAPNIMQNEQVEDTAVIGKVINEEAIWSCTTCRACQEVCPVYNEHIDKIIDLRRYLQMISTTGTAHDCLKNLRVRGNPWRGTMHARTDWIEDLDIRIVGENSKVDTLFWVGCTGALEDRSLKVTQSVARILQLAGVNFGILGEEELCCGDPARRLGAEHIYQMLATNNIQLLQSYNIRKIVTACPHCYNTLKNEYPQLGGNFEVFHHTELIEDLIKNQKLKPVSASKELRVTYQDPCYLGRYNDIYDSPRNLITSIPGLSLSEMQNNRNLSFCCGGGGGRMWLEEKTGQRINEMRLQHALGSKSQIIATACPFCLQMFEDAVRSREESESMQVLDIAELLYDHLKIQQDNTRLKDSD